jgi:hypothetical protein
VILNVKRDSCRSYSFETICIKLAAFMTKIESQVDKQMRSESESTTVQKGTTQAKASPPFRYIAWRFALLKLIFLRHSFFFFFL